ncbi:hypothetical protein BKA93DRAFT_895842 [Sparassis latifolia]
MTDSVTISLLPVSLSLVHLPRSRLETLSQHVLRQILQPSPIFLNVTCNEIELSLFAERHALKDFEKIARKDAQKLRSRRREEGGETHPTQDHKRSKRQKEDWEPVEVSSDKWNVLQIDSHSDRLDTSGARVHELSAPLAAAGISILYQSSYMCDFIFVKSYRLSEVMSLLASAGFDLYSSDPYNLTAQLSTFTSPMLSPTREDISSINILDLATAQVQRHGIDPEGGAVFSRSRSNTNSSSSSSGGRTVPQNLHVSSQRDFEDDSPANQVPERPDAKQERAAQSRSQSHSPSGCEVRVLEPDLTYVGLSDDSVEMWGLKIVKLVAFPELIVPVRRGSGGESSSSAASHGRHVSPSPAHPALDQVSEPVHLPTIGLSDDVDAVPFHINIASDGEKGNGSGSDTTTRVGPDSPKGDPAFDMSPVSPLFEMRSGKVWEDVFDLEDSSDEEDHRSKSPSEEPHKRETSEVLAAGQTRPFLPHLETLKPAHDHSRSASTSSTSSAVSTPPLLVPFFSFTRTSEGSSLTAPVSLLAALFPPSERHMVICSDELDILDSRVSSPITPEGPEVGESEDHDDERNGAQGPLRCLQIDLRKFGLDKHGLVNRYSRTLEENGINHMYSSTYKTANLLVDKAHASRAQALLRSC